ncbi:flap endonuclease GEN homolog 1 [Syngnathus acus]|uniref:flap endonuclease GEN homolog 1 n=1 Tax=Syngnathus acus TaxID=161584 RepID=UPI001885DC89|nr:flap endonuclease GEN homolog 1 [Syngnathus acus]
MGVHDLWSIVEPVRESVPLYSLSGKRLAVDLSLWVCEAQHVQAMMGRVAKPHLRNLFFRVSSLILMGVKLVFVMEGQAPKLKAVTMSQRTANRYGGNQKGSKSSTSTSRGRFNAVLRECAEMLDYLGMPWVVAAGEAEAMCAYLDSCGLVDGCITNDGDVFLYGARTVYRNFNMNSKDPQVDCYKTSRVQTELCLSRENLVGLAILLGCDYIPKGVPGVGKEQALKLIQTIKGQTLLQRFMRWKDEPGCLSQAVVKKLPHCHICRHPGSAKGHERSGCVLCDSQQFCQPQDFDYQCPCDWHRLERARQAKSLEANIKKKTLASPQFPFTEIINEFLLTKDKPVENFKRRQPNMLSMQKFALDKMEWPKHYTSEKVLVLMTYTELMNRKCGWMMSSQIKPIRIFKQRVRNSISCFEVIWSTPDHYVFPEDRPAEDQREVRSVEEENLFRAAFPEVVENYLRDKALAEENKTKKRKPKSKKEKMAENPDGVSELLAQMTLQNAPPEKALPTSPQTLLSETPVSHKQHQRFTENGSQVDSSAAAIDVLHLSDIDWDAFSFTATPPPQAAPECPNRFSNQLSLLVPILKSPHKDGSGIKKSCEVIPKVDKKPPHQYKFVRSASTKVQRCHSQPCPVNKIKKSVCVSVCSSSEDSDEENRQVLPRRTTESKQSLQSGDYVTRAPRKIQADINDVFPPTPASPIVVLDSDDSVVCGDSPLPLAERLRLKFLK